MKGLLLKDWYMMKKYCRTYVLVVLLFLAVSVLNAESMFFAFYPCLLCVMIPVTLLGYDEKSRWLLYSGALPYSRKQIVSEKYLTGLFLQAAVLIITGIVQAVKMSAAGSFSAGSFLLLMFSILFVSAFASSIPMPCIFKYGVEKGRIAYYVMVGFVCASGTLASKVFGKLSPSGGNKALTYLILAFAAAGVYILSWYLSVIFYEKREL